MSSKFIEIELTEEDLDQLYEELHESEDGVAVIEVDLGRDRLVDKGELKDLKEVYSLAIDYVLGLPEKGEE